jgi:hypothetical protein
MLNDTLIKLARISPKEYADVIRARNEGLLWRLLLLEPFIGTTVNLIPRELRLQVTQPSGNGCPHCIRDGNYKCESCLWTRVVPELPAGNPCRLACVSVEFNGETLHEQHYPRTLYVGYGHDNESIHLDDPDAKIDPAEFASARKFLEAHIEWANLDCWGADYTGL